MYYFHNWITLTVTWNNTKIYIHISLEIHVKQSLNSICIIRFDSCPQCQLQKHWVVWYQWRGHCMQWEEYCRTPTPPENWCPTISKETHGPCCLKWKKSDTIPVSKKEKTHWKWTQKTEKFYVQMRSWNCQRHSCQFPKVWFCILWILW